MSEPSKSEKWIAAMKKAGHEPQLYDGRLDTFAMDAGYHNGPGCEKCGASWCWHCDDISMIRPCRAASLPLHEGSGE